MKLLKRFYKHYLNKWDVAPIDLLWIALVFAMTGFATMYLRRILTPVFWGDYRGWIYYVTMPIVFIGIYYGILLTFGTTAGYREVFVPIVKRPLLGWQKIRHWLKRG